MVVVASLKELLLEALRQDWRLDGRKPFDSRGLTIKFGREDGTAEVQLGQSRIMCVVSCQLVQPYFDQPNEGLLVVYAEFSPMADPTFEIRKPTENAAELGRLIEHGLRESRAVDTESLCVLPGKAVWSLRVDIHVLDNGGNLIDAGSIAALAGLLSFRKPECGFEAAQRQNVIIYPPEVIDPSYEEELLMRGRLTVILNINGDICAMQKAGGVGVNSCEVLRCLQIASTKVADVTSFLEKAVEAHQLDRVQVKQGKGKVLMEMEDLTGMCSVAEATIVVFENYRIINFLETGDADAIVDGDLETSMSELVVKQEGRRLTERTKNRWSENDSVAELGVSASQTDSRMQTKALSSKAVATLPRQRAGEIQYSATQHGDFRHLELELEPVGSHIYNDLEKLTIHTSPSVGPLESGGPVKGKPHTLLDAVKWQNLKRSRTGGTQT